MSAKKTTTKSAPKSKKAKSAAEEMSEATPTTTSADAKPAKSKKARDAKTTKMSALDAAAKVLVESGEPMNAKALIEAMATKGYWTSPGGKTPHATLFAAILREINTKGKEARFTKASKGHFAATKNA